MTKLWRGSAGSYMSYAPPPRGDRATRLIALIAAWAVGLLCGILLSWALVGQICGAYLR